MQDRTEIDRSRMLGGTYGVTLLLTVFQFLEHSHNELKNSFERTRSMKRVTRAIREQMYVR